MVLGNPWQTTSKDSSLTWLTIQVSEGQKLESGIKSIRFQGHSWTPDLDSSCWFVLNTKSKKRLERQLENTILTRLHFLPLQPRSLSRGW